MRGANLSLLAAFLFTSPTLIFYGRRWKTLTRAGYIPTAISLLLAQTCLLLFCLAMATVPAGGETRASRSGMLTDQTGAALRDVAVTVKNVNTGVKLTIPTDSGGHYQASGLPLGRFEIHAAKQGFANETRVGISLAVGENAMVDIKMQRSTPDACASGHE